MSTDSPLIRWDPAPLRNAVLALDFDGAKVRYVKHSAKTGQWITCPRQNASKMEVIAWRTHTINRPPLLTLRSTVAKLPGCIGASIVEHDPHRRIHIRAFFELSYQQARS